MRLTSLTLEHFRSYERAELALGDADVQFFVGENGTGKTNLLESISVLAFSKSFLPVEEEHLRTWGAEFYRVRGAAISDAKEVKTLEVVSQAEPRRQKACFRNDVRVPIAELVGQLPVVIFLPQDLTLFTGPPADRRRFLDQILCQVSPEYFVAVVEYQKVLRQRNALLKRIASGVALRAEMDPWDERLASRAAAITLLRLELIETFGMALREEIEVLGEEWREVKIDYQRSGTARTEAALKTEIQGQLRSGLDRDVFQQSTGTGPHRDDWQMTVDGHPLPSFASRGQQRIAVLALLFLEASYLELRKGERPLILLDDIFSELDERHRTRVIESFHEHQVFLTGTEVPPEAAKRAQVWEIQHGRAERLAHSG